MLICQKSDGRTHDLKDKEKSLIAPWLVMLKQIYKVQNDLQAHRIM